MEISDDRVPKDLGLTVFLTAEPLGEMADQLGELRGKGLFRQTDRIVELVENAEE